GPRRPLGYAATWREPEEAPDSQEHEPFRPHANPRGRPHRRAARLRGHAALRAWRVGRAGGPEERRARAAAGRRVGRELCGHGGRVRARGERACDLLGSPPLPREPRHRHEGRLHPAGAWALEDQRPPKAPARGLRGEPPPPQARTHRPLPAPPAGQPHPPRALGRGPGPATGGGEDPARRPLERDGRATGEGAGDRSHRLRPEPLQPERPPLRGRPARLRAPGHRLYPVAAARDRQAGASRRGARRDLRRSRRHLPAGRPRLAAGPLAGDAPDPRHLLGRAPRRERRRPRDSPRRRRGENAHALEAV
ncbi:MAG: Putative oxidoreductase, partial [uncultured Rubrobacteraceae bacterium]